MYLLNEIIYHYTYLIRILLFLFNFPFDMKIEISIEKLFIIFFLDRDGLRILQKRLRKNQARRHLILLF